MRKRKHTDEVVIEEENFEIEHPGKKRKRKKSWLGKLTVVLIFGLIIGFIAQSSYFVYANRDLKGLIFKEKVTPKVEEVTPKEEIVLTAYEKQTSEAVKSMSQFVGDKSEAVAIATDFTAKYFTMSNLKTQLDFLGSEYLYNDSTIEKNFREYSLTNYYYYFPDLKNHFGQEGLPEVSSVEIDTVEKINYTHSKAEKVQGYAYSAANNLQSNQEFMNKVFKGYKMQISFTYKGKEKPLSWMKTAPNTLDITVLFDNLSSKWFVSEFQTSLKQKNTNGTTTITYPNRIK